MTDAELVAACRRGDPEAWRALVERFSRYVYAICTQGFRLSEADAEDVFQEVFARTYQHLGRLHDDEAIRPWIAQLTRRLAIDRLRAAKREHPTDALPEESAVDAALERIADAMTVRDALATLPEHCREIIDRFYTRDESYQAIGAALDIPAGTIASRLARCLDKLRRTLQPQPVDAAT